MSGLDRLLVSQLSTLLQAATCQPEAGHDNSQEQGACAAPFWAGMQQGFRPLSQPQARGASPGLRLGFWQLKQLLSQQKSYEQPQPWQDAAPAAAAPYFDLSGSSGAQQLQALAQQLAQRFSQQQQQEEVGVGQEPSQYPPARANPRRAPDPADGYLQGLAEVYAPQLPHSSTLRGDQQEGQPLLQNARRVLELLTVLQQQQKAGQLGGGTGSAAAAAPDLLQSMPCPLPQLQQQPQLWSMHDPLLSQLQQQQAGMLGGYPHQQQQQQQQWQQSAPADLGATWVPPLHSKANPGAVAAAASLGASQGAPCQEDENEQLRQSLASLLAGSSPLSHNQKVQLLGLAQERMSQPHRPPPPLHPLATDCAATDQRGSLLRTHAPAATSPLALDASTQQRAMLAALLARVVGKAGQQEQGAGGRQGEDHHALPIHHLLPAAAALEREEPPPRPPSPPHVFQHKLTPELRLQLKPLLWQRRQEMDEVFQAAGFTPRLGADRHSNPRMSGGGRSSQTPTAPALPAPSSLLASPGDADGPLPRSCTQAQSRLDAACGGRASSLAPPSRTTTTQAASRHSRPSGEAEAEQQPQEEGGSGLPPPQSTMVRPSPFDEAARDGGGAGGSLNPSQLQMGATLAHRWLLPPRGSSSISIELGLVAAGSGLDLEGRAATAADRGAAADGAEDAAGPEHALHSGVHASNVSLQLSAREQQSPQTDHSVGARGTAAAAATSLPTLYSGRPLSISAGLSSAACAAREARVQQLAGLDEDASEEERQPMSMPRTVAALGAAVAAAHRPPTFFGAAIRPSWEVCEQQQQVASAWRHRTEARWRPGAVPAAPARAAAERRRAPGSVFAPAAVRPSAPPLVERSPPQAPQRAQQEGGDGRRAVRQASGSSSSTDSLPGHSGHARDGSLPPVLAPQQEQRALGACEADCGPAAGRSGLPQCAAACLARQKAACVSGESPTGEAANPAMEAAAELLLAMQHQHSQGPTRPRPASRSPQRPSAKQAPGTQRHAPQAAAAPPLLGSPCRPVAAMAGWATARAGCSNGKDGSSEAAWGSAGVACCAQADPGLSGHSSALTTHGTMSGLHQPQQQNGGRKRPGHVPNSELGPGIVIPSSAKRRRSGYFDGSPPAH